MHQKGIPFLVAIAVLVSTIVGSAQNDTTTSKLAALGDELSAISVDVSTEFRRESDPVIPLDPQRGTKWLEPAAVIRIAVSTRSLLLQRLAARSEFAAMKDYVALRFPSPPQPTGRDPLSGAPAVPQNEGRAYVEGVLAFLNRVSAKPLAVNLDVVTFPDGADVELRTDAVLGPATRTDARLVNVYRGLYSFRVSKSLFKPAAGQLNLVDDDRQRFECTLARTDDVASESSCLRR